MNLDTDPSLVALRHRLHAAPELSGAEAGTARLLREMLQATDPDQIIEGLGGHGLALVYDSGMSGPGVMFRAELDALPIAERGHVPHASTLPGIAHLCGHDGHMAILAGLARHLGRDRPARGRVILLFQPAEETGAGARAVLADPRFDSLRPDWAFALHNMPGLGLGQIAVAAGPASCASVGLHLRWQGREAHASSPETGLSPAHAVASLMAALAPFSTPGPVTDGFRLATLCHLSMGARAFGIAPASAEAMVTLRAISDAGLERFERDIATLAEHQAGALALQISRHDHFNASINDPHASRIVARAADALGLVKGCFALPMRASEDFGAFSAVTRTALFFIGAGEGHPALHDPEYDFPDALIAPAQALFTRILSEVMAH